MADLHPNAAYSTVATAPSPATSGTTLTVATNEGARFPTGSFDLTIWPAGAVPLWAAGSAAGGNFEICRATRSGDVLTLTRAQYGTTARTVVVGDQVAINFTDHMLTDAENSPADGWLVEANSFASPNTTVASGSNAVATSTFAGSGTLNVASTTGFPTAGIINITHSGSVSQVSYTGVTSTTFTGCYLIAGPTVTMSTSDVVRLHGFTIASATDYSTRYQAHARVKWSESATVKRAVVGSSSFASSVTSIVFVATDDYQPTTTPDASSTYYSYAARPQGFPVAFAWTPNLSGWSANPTNSVYEWHSDGSKIHLNFNQGTAGTSNSVSHTGTLPFTAATVTNDGWLNLAYSLDNNVAQAGYLLIGSAGRTVSLPGVIATNASTLSGSSRILGQIAYRI